MKTKIELPKVIYPALAIYSGDGEKPDEFDKEDVLLISKITTTTNKDKLHASYVFGNKESYDIREVKEYWFLPKGSKITVEQ